MDQDKKEPTLKESIVEVMQTLPSVMRTYLEEGRYTQVVKNLMVKYKLHIDQATVLERETMLLLMGLENPTEFIQSLSEEAHIDSEIIKDITTDINDLIFVPLRNQEEKEGVSITTNQLKTSARSSAVQAFSNQKRITGPELILEPAPPLSAPVTPSVSPKPFSTNQPGIKNDIPPNLPGAIMPTMSSPAPTPRQKIRVTPPVTSYNKDPYREPIDEPEAGV